MVGGRYWLDAALVRKGGRRSWLAWLGAGRWVVVHSVRDGRAQVREEGAPPQPGWVYGVDAAALLDAEPRT